MQDLVVLLGTNASGKSDLGIRLAQHFGGEIVSADSRQVYRGLDLGSGKITPAQAAEVKHHLIDVAEVSEKGANSPGSSGIAASCGWTPSRIVCTKAVNESGNGGRRHPAPRPHNRCRHQRWPNGRIQPPPHSGRSTMRKPVGGRRAWAKRKARITISTSCPSFGGRP
jgi:hypothetical protein